MLCKHWEWQMVSISCNIIYRVSLYSEKQNFGTPCTKKFFWTKMFLSITEEKSIFFRGKFQQELVENLNFQAMADWPLPCLYMVNYTQHYIISWVKIWLVWYKLSMGPMRCTRQPSKRTRRMMFVSQSSMKITKLKSSYLCHLNNLNFS